MSQRNYSRTDRHRSDNYQYYERRDRQNADYRGHGRDDFYSSADRRRDRHDRDNWSRFNDEDRSKDYHYHSEQRRYSKEDESRRRSKSPTDDRQEILARPTETRIETTGNSNVKHESHDKGASSSTVIDHVKTETEHPKDQEEQFEDTLEQEQDEAALIEEKRRKRLEILKKYKTEEKAGPVQPIVTPTMLTQQYEQKVVETSSKRIQQDNVNQKSGNYVGDDMFSDVFTLPHAANQLTQVTGENANLADNWDDPDGYYQITIGDILKDRYKITHLLGRGVFASVVKAQDLKCTSAENEVVAIKILRNNPVMYKAGQKEWQLLSKFRELDPEGKRCVIRAFESFEHRKHLCIVFESMSMNLREVIKKFGGKTGLNLRAIRTFAKQLFGALSLLRQAKICHSDIKPDNILINESKTLCRLADLGSAAEVSENEITPYLISRFYRPPEVILGLKYDYAIDIWSIACTLYELFTGTILFPGKTNNHMLKLMMETKGRFPLKMLRKGEFSGQHFDFDDSETTILFIDQHPETSLAEGPTVRKFVPPLLPTNDLKSRLLNEEEKERISSSDSPEEEMKLLISFIDLLEKCLMLNPEKRLAVKDALAHPFVS